MIRPSLVASVCPPEPPKRKPKQDLVVHGPKVRKAQPLKPGALPDATVLEIRAIREFRGLSWARIADLYDLDPMRVQNLCNYCTRAHLVPTIDDLPPE